MLLLLLPLCWSNGDGGWEWEYGMAWHGRWVKMQTSVQTRIRNPLGVCVCVRVLYAVRCASEITAKMRLLVWPLYTHTSIIVYLIKAHALHTRTRTRTQTR